MAIGPGTQFGQYEILESVGAGGMGEVWRARDPELEREVAIKVLPASFADDADRVARFEQEAKTLAALNHPNIAHIYGIVRGADATGLVMELIDGPTLADRIGQGPIPADEAIGIAMQIAAALEPAHARGIVHRDLKPANIKLREDGTVKVLDFGIAKALDTRAISGPSAPALTTPAMTEAGIILGTAAYMSPEQARGKPVDQRADIWSFGVLLYEMLTGQPAFGGEDVSITLARVLERDTDMSSVPTTLPPAVRHTIRLCLQKDPKNRIADIRDVKLALAGAFESEGGATGQAARRGPISWSVAAAAALLSASVVSALWWSLESDVTPEARPTRFIVRTPDGMPLTEAPSAVALSADGRELVYAVGSDSTSRLFRHSLDSFESIELDSAPGAVNPVFGPGDSRIAFYSNSAAQMQQLDLAGGRPTRLVSADGALGASWSDDGTLVYTSNWSAPLRVLRPGASEAVDLTRVDSAAGELSHLWPQILPGNRSVLFTIWSGDPEWDQAHLAVVDLDGGQHRYVLDGGVGGRYVDSGHLVFWRSDALMAVPFDLDTLSVRGDPVRVVEDVRMSVYNGGADFAVSGNGTLAYVEGSQTAYSETVVVDRTGQTIARIDADVATGDPAFSPDGRRLALTLYRGGLFGVGVYDIGRERLTSINVPGDNLEPSWTNDGERITFVSSAEGEYSLYTNRADGSGSLEAVFAEPQGFIEQRPARSADGRYLLFAQTDDGSDLWIFEPGTDAAPRRLLATAADETAPSFSPDGRFIVYASDESGEREIYVVPFPDVTERKFRLSDGGGGFPRWRGDEIFYMTDRGLMSVPVDETDASGPFGVPSLVLEMSNIKNFDVSPDGRMFAIERTPIEAASNEIHVVENWFEELKRLVPVD